MFTQKIIVPTDFSPASMLAVDAGAKLAKSFDAEITLLFVYDPSLLSPLFVVPGGGALVTTPKLEEFEGTAKVELERIRDERLGGLRKVTFAIAKSPSAAEGICDYARASEGDLIVIATHGRTGLAHMLIGSVAEKVVRHASCPVLTLRSKAT